MSTLKIEHIANIANSGPDVSIDTNGHLNIVNGSLQMGGTTMLDTSDTTLKNVSKIGIGTATPGYKLHLHESSSSESYQLFTNSTTGATTSDGLRIGIDSNENALIWHREAEDIIFATSNAEKMRLLSSGVVNIGTAAGTQPSYFNSFLNVQNNASTGSHASITITSGSGGYAGLHFGDSDNGRIGQVAYNNSDNSLLFTANNYERVRIDSSGNVGIGTTNPTHVLELKSSGNANQDFIMVRDSDNNQQFRIYSDSSTGEPVLRLYDTSGSAKIVLHANGVSRFEGGNVGIGATSPGTTLQVGDGSADTRSTFNPNTAFAIGVKNGSNHGGFIGSAGTDTMQFSASSGAARMTIDSSGRLLVGKQSSNYATEGVEIRSNEILITKAGANPLSVRNNGAGGIISFNSAGTSVGNIGIESSGFYVDGEGSHAGLKLYASAIGPRQNGADIDATIDLGWTGGKFKDIYASGTVYATPGGNDGSSANYAANSANEILNNYGYKPSGLYWIREPNTGTPKQIYCDMETDGGGWMLWLEYNTSTNSMHNQATARGNLARSYNNNYSKYEVMIDSSWVGQINRRSLRGVWELDANGGIRTTGFRNWGEVRLPETVGDLFQPDLDTFYNMGSNGEWIKRGEYYAIAGASGWSSIGSGSQYVYIREPNPAVKPGTLRSYYGINYEWAYDGTQYGWWIHESSYAVPMFNSLTKNSGYAVTYDGGRRDVFEPNNTTGQNSYVNVNNGNNGPGVVGVGAGVLVGEFSIMFNLGYSWGWSEMYIADAVNVNKSLAGHGSPYALKDQWGVANNSSNNQSYYQWKTNDGVTQLTQSGLTPYSFGNYWTWNRQANGSVYLRTPGADIYNLGTFFGPMKFFTGAQSPHSAQILNVQSAGRNSTLSSGSGNAQTYLRH